MTATAALAAFTAIESDIIMKAIAWSRALTCAIAIRTDEARLGTVRIHSSITGVLTFIDIDGIAIPRERFIELYVTPYVERLDALHQARKLAHAAAENIRNYARARRKHFRMEEWEEHIPSSAATVPCNDRPPVVGRTIRSAARRISIIAPNTAGDFDMRKQRDGISTNAEWFSLSTILKSAP